LNIISNYGKLFAAITGDEHIYVKYIIHNLFLFKTNGMTSFKVEIICLLRFLQSNWEKSLRNVYKSVGNNSVKSLMTCNILNEPGKSFCFCTLWNYNLSSLATNFLVLRATWETTAFDSDAWTLSSLFLRWHDLHMAGQVPQNYFL